MPICFSVLCNLVEVKKFPIALDCTMFILHGQTVNRKQKQKGKWSTQSPKNLQPKHIQWAWGGLLPNFSLRVTWVGPLQKPRVKIKHVVKSCYPWYHQKKEERKLLASILWTTKFIFFQDEYYCLELVTCDIIYVNQICGEKIIIMFV